MEVKMSFGEHLSQLLLLRGWSASRLAREINIDPSYVQMWIRGERVPSLNTEYVEQIALIVIKGLDSNQKKYLHNLYMKNCRDFEISQNRNATLEELTFNMLKKAQIHSLSKRHERKSENGKNMLWAAGQKGMDECGIPDCIEGRNAIILAILRALKLVVDDRSRKPGKMVFTFQSDSDIFQGYDTLYKTWKGLIYEALERGWKVDCLHRLSKNAGRAVRLADEIVSWVEYNSNFFPSFFAKHGTINPPQEIFVIGNTCAFLLVAADNCSDIDRALFFRQRDMVDALFKYTSRMHQSTASMLRLFPRDFDFFEHMVSISSRKGNLNAMSPDLHTCTLPLQLWDKYLKRTICDEEEREKHFRYRKELLHIFMEDVKKCRIRHICQLKALEHMVESKEYLYLKRFQKPEPEDITEHLRHTVHLLKSYDNLEIAFLDDERDGEALPATFWEVRDGRDVGIVACDRHGKARPVYLGITEETVADAFNDYFMDIWERITPKYRDKEFVISWLEKKALAQGSAR